MPKYFGENSRIRPYLVTCCSFLSLLSAVCIAASASLAGAEELPGLAVADFDFRDTSGEVRDQTAEHDARLEMFGISLRDGISDGEKTKLVTLPCQAQHCSANHIGLRTIAAQARKANVRYLLFGEIHKMSTLVGWVKFAMVDLNKNEPICDRFLTYRGDTDEAWRRAAKFTARDIVKYCLP